MKHQNRKTKHHITPKSRGGKNTLENICRVQGKEHEKYHYLFDNRTPEEILDYLTNTFWNGDKSYVIDYYNSISLGID